MIWLNAHVVRGLKPLRFDAVLMRPAFAQPADCLAKMVLHDATPRDLRTIIK